MAPIDRLPDLCLLALFRQMSPADQYRAQFVCLRWNELVLSVTRKRRFLAIIVGDYALKEANTQINIFSHGSDRFGGFGVSVVKACNTAPIQPILKEDGSPLLPIHRLNGMNTVMMLLDRRQYISSTFTGLQHLFIAIENGKYEQVGYLANLLETWRDQLITLKIQAEAYNSKQALMQLYNTINSMTSLKCLCLNLDPRDAVPEMPILAQLEEFSVAYGVERAMRNISKYVNANSAIKRISFHTTFRSVAEIARTAALLLSEPVRNRIQLVETFRALDYDYRTVCAHLRGLTTLEIALVDTTFGDFLIHASQLTSLVRLYIQYDALLPDNRPNAFLPQLPSVRMLQVAPTLSSHRDLGQLHLGHTMPNVEIIRIIFQKRGPHPKNRCDVCRIKELKLNRFHVTKLCYLQLFELLQLSCPLLRAIIHDVEYVLGSGVQLLTG